jgi:outer membrane receptor for ferric coprogen and ferric-rhodotorulic acid
VIPDGRGGATLAQVPSDTSYQSPFDFSKQDLDRVRIRFEKPFGASTRLKNLAYLTRLQWRSDGTLLVGAFSDPRVSGPLVARTLTALDDDQRLYGNRVWWETDRNVGPSRHRIALGAEAYALKDEYSLDVALLPVMSIGQPFETARRPLALIPGQSLRADAGHRVLSAFASNEASFGASLRAFAGIRADSIQFAEDTFRIEETWNRVSPFAGANLSLSETVSAFASASSGVSPASTLALGSREPEETRQFEGGLRFASTRDGRSFRASVTAYELTRDNITIPDGSGLPRPTGDQRSRGIEAEGSFEKGALGVFAQYGFTDAVLTSFRETGIVGVDPRTFLPVFGSINRSGNAAPFAPRHLLSLRARAEIAKGVVASATMRRSSAQFIAEDNAFAISASTFVDASVAYSRGPGRFAVIADNLLDEETHTRGDASYSVLPVAPRRVSVRVDLRYDGAR